MPACTDDRRSGLWCHDARCRDWDFDVCVPAFTVVSGAAMVVRRRTFSAGRKRARAGREGRNADSGRIVLFVPAAIVAPSTAMRSVM